MKDAIQQAGDEVSIVIYDAPLPPRYFRFTKRFIKTFFVVVPVLLGLSFIFLFIWGLSPRIVSSPRPKLPEVISPMDSKVAELESEIRNLQSANKALTDKISTLPSTTTGEDPYLMGILKPYGMQNFLAQNKVYLDQIEFTEGADGTHLKFQIISSTPETKVSGHIIVFMLTELGMRVYPAEASASLSQGIKYSLGETFAVSRLRPTDATFAPAASGKSAKFIIYIFSREGDLLLIKESETFKTGNKQ